ncbi:MAG: four helix bundle protein [Anaerolineales bacterium]
MQDFKQLKVWQKAHQLTLQIYKSTKGFPKTEVYGLTNQIRRSSSSIPTNIAEGCVQSTDAQFSRFLYIALGSAAELDYQILLAHELEYIDSIVFKNLQSEVDQVKKMLAALIGKLKA